MPQTHLPRRILLILDLIFILIAAGIGAGVIFLIWVRHWPRSQVRESKFYICLDGHLVRSRGEWMVDATLQFLGVAHEYEPRIQIGRQTLHPDFGLSHGIYIEYWGLQTKTYLQNKKAKQKLYRGSNFHLINIENADLKNLLHVLTSKLRPYEHLFPQLHNTFTVLGSGSEGVK